MENITIRPGKKYAGLVDKVREAAAKSGRSMNNYVLFLLDSHLKNQHTDEQVPGQSFGGSPHSEGASIERTTD